MEWRRNRRFQHVWKKILTHNHFLSHNKVSETYKVGFLNFSIIDIWHPILCCRECPGHCRMFRSIVVLYPLDAEYSTPLCCWDQKMSSDIAKLRTAAQKKEGKERQHCQGFEILINKQTNKKVGGLLRVIQKYHCS